MAGITLTGITWITTYNCNLECKHCFFDTKGKPAYMQPALIDRCLKDFDIPKSMYWQHLSGGEIFLQPQKVIDITRTIRKYFSGNIGLSTNGIIGSNTPIAHQVFQQLKAHNIGGMAVSSDYYHQQQMKLEPVENTLALIKEYKMDQHTFLMGGIHSDDTRLAEEINSWTYDLWTTLDPENNIPRAPALIRSIGRGASINKPKKKRTPKGPCNNINECLGKRGPMNPAMVWIDPYGNVMICYGIVIGNIYNTPLKKIISDYSIEYHPMLKILAIEGPDGLRSFAEKEFPGQIPKVYYDSCDVCYQSRKVLKRNYPEIFSPDECYP